MQEMRYIREAEFSACVADVLLDLQRAIARSGLTISEIARGTRMKWSTVYNASQGTPVRIESMCRIHYYLAEYSKLKAQNEKKTAG